MRLSRPWRLRSALLGCFTGVLVACGGAADDGELPPNVILISLDTLRYDHCGLYGYERDTTPFLDEFAAGAAVFDRAYTTMCWTLIAHMSMLTGLFPTQHQVIRADKALTPTFPTLAQRLHEEGWTTMGVHFPGWLDARYGFGRGFDYYESADNAEQAEERLADATKLIRDNRPFFLFIHLFDVHSGDMSDPASTIYDPPPPYDSKWVPDAKERLADIDALAWWEEPCAPTADQHEAVVALYDGGISYVDDKLRQWFADWEERGWLENTLVIITSDHGEGLRQRLSRYGGHGEMHEEGLRIPLIVRYPDGEHAGQRFDSLVSLVDLVPTALAELGLDEDDRLPGIELIEEQRAEDEWVFVAREKARAAISSTQKIVYRDRQPQVLYDLVQDPGELDPLKPSIGRARFDEIVGPILAEALSQLDAKHLPDPPIDPDALDEAEKARLEALGYGGELGG